jgi:hypothetical protein
MIGLPRLPCVVRAGQTRLAALAGASFLAVALASAISFAQNGTIRNPGDHPSYVFEAEPHFLLGYAGPFDQDSPAGAGFRGTFDIANGFVKSINDSVGVGIGFDIAGDGRVLVPIVMQWNFWLAPHFSVFGEPGISFGSGPRDVFYPAFYAGGRIHFTDRIAMTLRVGYPDISLGVSFLL